VRSAIVTGATSGIGRATAIALGRAGYWVLVGGRDEGRGQHVLEQLGEGAGGDFLPGELTVEGIPERLVAETRAATGRLDAVVNSAGVHFLATVEQTTPERFDELMAVNVRAAVMLCRAAIPVMRESGGGVIVNVASEAGLVAVPGQVAYNISKAALVMLTKSLAADHSVDNIRAVTVCPGTTRTPLVDDAIASSADPVEHERWLASSRPANRLGDPEEIAKAILFAIEGGADYMTGSEIVIDGGYTAV
jgi:meso-butanediol dehydrogenase/(S,S)-butanediol dehydrogenase/diacetyl reductase